MIDEERVTMLEETLYFFTRYRSSMEKGAMADSHLERLSGLADDALDSRISTIEWAIALRDIRSLRAMRTS